MKKRFVSRVSGKVEGTNITLWGVYDKEADQFVASTVGIARAEAIAKANEFNAKGLAVEPVAESAADELNRKAVSWVSENVDFDKLVVGIRRSLADAKHYGNKNDERNQWEAYVAEIVSSSWGHMQDAKVAEFFGIEYDPDNKESLWGKIDSFASHVADVINRHLRNHRGIEGRVWFGHLDSGGSYGLFYSEEIKKYEAVIFDAWSNGESIWTNFEEAVNEVRDFKTLFQGYVVGGDKEVIEAIEINGDEWFDTYDDAIKAVKSLKIGEITIA